MAVNDSAKPPARTKGPSLRSEPAAPKMSGSSGSTQGERVETAPAKKPKASKTPPQLLLL